MERNAGGEVVKLSEHLSAIAIAKTPKELEARCRAAHHQFKPNPPNRTWGAISKARVARAAQLIAEHPNGHLIPVLGPRHLLTVCGETYKVGYGQNGAGVRWAWAGAEKWAMGVLKKNRVRAATQRTIWAWALGDYPDRALAAVEHLKVRK